MIHAYNQTINLIPFSKNDINYILKHYGNEKQTAKAGEELAELIQVINKYIACCISPEAFREKLIEETADSIIMMNQLMIAYEIKDDEINEAIHKKLVRQIERILDEN